MRENTLADSIVANSACNSEGTNIWLFITIGAVVIAALLLAAIYVSQKSKGDRSKIADGEGKEIDMTNVINSMFMAKELYDKLARAVHPDRFPDGDGRTEKANELFQQIAKNKNNYEELKRLKEEAEKELNITIKG